MDNRVYILLDRSGSMETMWSEALGGINGYVQGLKGDISVMLAAFDSMGYDVLRNTTVEGWKKVTSEDVTPRGGTPLLDAAGRIIHNILDSGAKKAILVVVTDGEENQSSKFNKHEIAALTKQLEAKDYEIVFLGANFAKIADVAKNNFNFSDKSRIMNTSIRGFGDAMSATSCSTQAYFSTGKATSFYSDADKKKASE
jgi:uncharacterized protein with von Willebrand factor type A (vWA) domain